MGKLRVLSQEEKERFGRLMLGEEHSPNGVIPKKGDDAAEIRSGEKMPNAAPFFHEAFKKYGEPTMSREELSKELSKELGGKSLSDLVIEERRSKPY